NITHLHSEIVDMGMDIMWDGYTGILLENNPLESPPIEIVKKRKRSSNRLFQIVRRRKTSIKRSKSAVGRRWRSRKDLVGKTIAWRKL
ncbi:hypothetical protein C5S39_03475, partial [Candidatus Methanophagaceae archaeon]